MKIQFICLLMLSVCFSSNYAMQTKIIMPPANVLKQRLSHAGFNIFIEKTEIVANLANKNIQPLAVAGVVERAIGDYVQYFRQNANALTLLELKINMPDRKLRLLEVLMQDYPDSFKELSYLLTKHE